MNWINAFELLCYAITAVFLWDVIRKKNREELCLFLSAMIAGFALELLAVRVTDIYHYSPDFYISIGFKPYQFPFFGGLMWGGHCKAVETERSGDFPGYRLVDCDDGRPA